MSEQCMSLCDGVQCEQDDGHYPASMHGAYFSDDDFCTWSDDSSDEGLLRSSLQEDKE